MDAVPRRRPTRTVVVLAAVLGAVLLGAVAVAVLLAWTAAWRPPARPSLARHPDHTLHGTVAYLDDASDCVRIVAAAGAPSRRVYCLPPQDVEVAKRLGKEQGPQLTWLRGGRLVVTMFRMTDPPGPTYEPGWQRIVDVRTGQVRDVAPDHVSSEPAQGTHPQVDAAGRRLHLVSADGDVRLSLVEGGRSRTLLAVDSNPEIGYRMDAAFWAPGGQWIAADDGRILVVVPSDPPRTRVLTAASDQQRFEGRLSRFAVTGQDLLAPDAGSG